MTVAGGLVKTVHSAKEWVWLLLLSLALLRSTVVAKKIRPNAMLATGSCTGPHALYHTSSLDNALVHNSGSGTGRPGTAGLQLLHCSHADRLAYTMTL